MRVYGKALEVFMELFVFFVFLMGLMVYLSPEAWASSTGSNASLPYESWLLNFQKSLTGPVAFSVALIGLVGSGITLIFVGGEINRFLRTMVYILMVMTLLIGANTVMTNFFNGATISASPPAAASAQVSSSVPQESSGHIQ